MSDNAGVALLAHIDAVHLDDALARVQTGNGCHRACQETEASKETKGEVSRVITVAHYPAGESGIRMTHKPARPPKNNCHISHILYTNLGWTTFLYCICNFSFLFWQLGRSVWEREEGSCLSGVDEGLSEGCDSDHKRTSRFTAIRRKCMAD